MSELTSENVEKVIITCLAEDLFETDPSYIKVEGIINTYAFNKEKLEDHRPEIVSWIEQLPNEFLIDGGGGWSFLNLCMRKDGVQWTGLHWVQEQFMCMAIGLGLAQIQLPREMWVILPGSVPYVVFMKEPAKV